jgi:hypothetical protein
MYDFNALAVSGMNVSAGGSGEEGSPLYLSTDKGTNWVEAGSGLPTMGRFGGVRELAVVGPDVYAGTYYDGVFLSTNNGTSWTAVNEGLPREAGDTTRYFPIQCLAVSGTYLFAGTSSDGVFLLTKNSATWTAVNDGFIDTVTSLTVSATDLIAGTVGGKVWRRPLSQMITSLDHVTTELPQEFLLFQNFPNPFNPSTAIRYELPKSSHVTLSVFDVLGRDVSVLVNEGEQPGVYSVRFDGSGLASGMYFYRLQAGDFVQTRRLLLLK